MQWGTAGKRLAATIAVIALTVFGIGIEGGNVALWVPSLLVIVLEVLVGAVTCEWRGLAVVCSEGEVASSVRTPDNEV